jgi:hypothetical protein
MLNRMAKGTNARDAVLNEEEEDGRINAERGGMNA